MNLNYKKNLTLVFCLPFTTANCASTVLTSWTGRVSCTFSLSFCWLRECRCATSSTSGRTLRNRSREDFWLFYEQSYLVRVFLHFGKYPTSWRTATQVYNRCWGLGLKKLLFLYIDLCYYTQSNVPLRGGDLNAMERLVCFKDENGYTSGKYFTYR